MSTGLPRPGLARSAHRGRIKFLRGYVFKSSAALNPLTITQLASQLDQVAWPSPSISGVQCACVIMVRGPIRTLQLPSHREWEGVGNQHTHSSCLVTGSGREWGTSTHRYGMRYSATGLYYCAAFTLRFCTLVLFIIKARLCA